MNGKLPKVTAKGIVAVLERVGFILTRQSGSHRIYKNADGKRITVPYHSGKVLHPKILKSILKDADIGLKELNKLI